MIEEILRTLVNIGVALSAIAMQFLVSVGVIPQNTYAPLPSGANTEYQTEAPSPQDTPAAQTKSASGTLTSPDKKKLPATQSSVATKTPSAIPKQDQTKTSVAPVQPTTPTLSSTEIDDAAHAAVVNILCMTKGRSVIQPISGSGMFIDPRGIIVTNAHIAQYFLLEQYKNGSLIDCRIRTGGPAQDTYDAEPMFVSSSWITKNAHTLIEETPTGTGENDIALLFVTKSLTSAPLPTTFPFMNYTIDENGSLSGAPVLVAAYPAEFVNGTSVLKDLWPVTAMSNIVEMFTFSANTPDVFSVKGSIVSQHGSSGGGAIDLRSGKLLGVIATTADSSTTVNRELNAITFEHIDAVVHKDAGMSLTSFLAKDPKDTAATFMQNRAPTLLNTLLTVLQL